MSNEKPGPVVKERRSLRSRYHPVVGICSTALALVFIGWQKSNAVPIGTDNHEHELVNQPGDVGTFPTIPIDGRPTRGPADAPITVIEFSDYECHFCAMYFRETYASVQANNGDSVLYIVKSYPTPGHRRAFKASEAAEWAHEQGKFWEYHTRLFEESPRLDISYLKQYATDLGLDRTTFDQCLDNGSKASVVDADVRDGKELGLRGPPSFFINRRRMYGSQPFSVFEAYFTAVID
jgi:protein-disulfide isomerase